MGTRLTFLNIALCSASTKGKKAKTQEAVAAVAQAVSTVSTGTSTSTPPAAVLTLVGFDHDDRYPELVAAYHQLLVREQNVLEGYGASDEEFRQRYPHPPLLQLIWGGMTVTFPLLVVEFTHCSS
jgi:hypothetical protein